VVVASGSEENPTQNNLELFLMRVNQGISLN
jgi:hypothetical protein